MKVIETKLVDIEPQLNEEDSASLKLWLSNRWTLNLKKFLEEQIEISIQTWISGSYVPDNQKSLSDYNAGVAMAHKRVCDFLTGESLTDVGNINDNTE